MQLPFFALKHERNGKPVVEVLGMNLVYATVHKYMYAMWKMGRENLETGNTFRSLVIVLYSHMHNGIDALLL